MATNNALNNSSNPLNVGNLSLATNTLSSSSGNIILAPVSGSSVAITTAPLTVGNLNLNTNTLSSTSGNIVLAPVSGSSVSINSAYTLPSTLGGSGQVLASNGAGALTFQTPTSSVLPWTRVETGTTAVNLVKSNGYIMANTTANVTFTLPSTAQVGDTFQIINLITAFNFIVKCSGSTELYLGSTPGPFAASGDVRSTELGCWLEIVCTDQDSSYMSCAKQGNFDVTES